MTMVQVELRVYIDLNGDGNFSGPNENVTAYVRAAEWFIGWRRRYQDVADTPASTIALDNQTQTWSPEVANALFAAHIPLQKQVRIAVFRHDTNVEATMWRGWIDRVEVVPGQRTGDRSAILHCVGHKHFLDEATLRLPLLENVTADQIIDAVFAATVQPIAKALQTGTTTYPYAGDTFDEFSKAYEAITAVVQAERGRFWYNRNGTAEFWNRATVATTLTLVYANIPYQTMTYEYASDVANDIIVSAYPRQLSATNNETLWARQGAFTIAPGEAQTVRASFNDGTGAQVAGRNLQVPNTSSGTLAFTGGNVIVTAFEGDARGATITLTNTGTATAEVTTLVVRGQKLTALNKEEARQENAASIAAYGRRALTIDLKLLHSFGLAQSVAEYELFKRATPRGVAASITQIAEGRRIHISALVTTVMTRVTVSEPQTGHTGTYWVIGEAHRWTPARWETTYALEPADTTAFWLVEVPGRSELNQTTVLGF